MLYVILYSIILLQTNRNLTVEAATGVIKKLVNITQSSNNLLGGDLIATNSIMKKIANSGKKSIPAEDTEVCS